MSKEESYCPTCSAPCNVSYDWDFTGYYFDESSYQKLIKENAGLRHRLNKLKIRNSKLKAKMREMYFNGLTNEN